MKSKRNKTIDISFDEGKSYYDKCITIDGKTSLDLVVDKIICGDMFEVSRCLPYCFADLVIADPPYNMDKSFGSSTFRRQNIDKYAQYTISWIDAVLPLMKDDASLYVCSDWRTGIVMGNILNERFKIINRITWQREKGRGASRNWKNSMEDIWFAVKSDKYTFNLDAVKIRKRVFSPYRKDGKPKDWEETAEGNFRNTCPSNFWDDISIPFWSMSENTAHPTQKPEKLFAKLILASSNCGDVIFDPFLGSGTTAVVAKKLDRRFVGIEQNKQYCVWSQMRLADADADKTIQGFSDGVFWERNTAAMLRKNR